ncbi:MAG: RNA-guided pseudouridylation complex pseudouridine synthase subunit Cbf5 [Candidatus Aenigmatarchaeota archaeon]
MWLIKSDEESDEIFGKRPEERTIEELIENCIIFVDKHSGPTSHQVSLWVKDIFHAKKVAHIGTLDPKVTGVLPVLLNEGVKTAILFQKLYKEYVGVMHIHKEYDLDNLKKIIAEKFVGRIVQTPPKKSAVVRKPREREVVFFNILEVEGKDILFHTRVEAGTYIRKLIDDIGKAYGVGAHMLELRRIKVGEFGEDVSVSLTRIRDAYEFWKNGEGEMLRKILIPVEFAIDHVKKVFVKDSAIEALCNGAPLFPIGISRIQEGIKEGETVAIMSLKNELVAIGIAKMSSKKMFESKRGIAVRIDRVIMKKGTYKKNY